MEDVYSSPEQLIPNKEPKLHKSPEVLNELDVSQTNQKNVQHDNLMSYDQMQSYTVQPSAPPHQMHQLQHPPSQNQDLNSNNRRLENSEVEIFYFYSEFDELKKQYLDLIKPLNDLEQLVLVNNETLLRRWNDAKEKGQKLFLEEKIEMDMQENELERKPLISELSILRVLIDSHCKALSL